FGPYEDWGLRRGTDVRRDDVAGDLRAAVTDRLLPAHGRGRAARRRVRHRGWEGNARGERRGRMHRQQEGRPRRLAEVEVGREVAEDRDAFAHVGSWVGTPVGAWVQPLAAEEVVLDELHVGVEAQGLVVDVTVFGVGTDNDGRNAQSVTVLVDTGWDDVVVEAAPVVPRQEDRGGTPFRALHDRVDQAGHVRLAGADRRRRVLAHVTGWDHPRHFGQRPVLRGGVEVRYGLDVGELTVVTDRVEVRQRIPDAGRTR